MKRIFTLLLAILMVVSLAACTKKTGERQDDETQTDNPTPVEENSYTVVDEVVYTAGANVPLYKDLSTKEGLVTVAKAATELHRVQVSTKLQASVVEYKGEQYYVASGLLTTADLYGKKYTPVDKTMYAASDLNVRSCADMTLSEVVGRLSKNDEVKVIAEGNGWSKIAYSKDGVSGEYFVSTSYLAAEQEEDYTKKDYSGYFTACEEEKTVLAENLNLRIAPVVKAATLAAGLSLKKGDKVTLVGYGKGAYASWGMVLYPEKAGATPKPFYVKLCAEDCSEVYIVIPEAALKNQIAKLGFTAKDESLFVITDRLNLRAAPSLGGGYAGEVKKGDKLAIVATGSVTEPDPDDKTQNVTIKWAMIKTTAGTYAYASTRYLAESMDAATGALTLDDLVAKYGFVEVEETEITAKADTICYYYPKAEAAAESTTKLKAGDVVTLVAKKEGTKAGEITWYAFKKGDAYFCAGKTQFN